MTFTVVLSAGQSSGTGRTFSTLLMQTQKKELIAELEKDVDVLYIETPTNPLMLELISKNCQH